jgi:hypothetical protein
MRRIIPITIALALAGTTLVAGSASTSNAAELAGKKKVETDFGMTATSYGTRVIGGPLPVDSSQTASMSLSCTNKSGINKRNYVATADLKPLTVRGVTSRTWTEKTGGVVSSYASHDVAHLNLFSGNLGSLDINGLSSQARAFHDSSGFHAQISSKIASITYTPKGGKPVGLTIPTIGKPLTIPGLLRLSIGVGRKIATAHGAEAVTSVIDLRLFPKTPNEVKAIVGQTKATIGDGIKSGLFYGRAVGLQANVLGNLVTVGQTPVQFMPCKGTEGKPVVKDVAGISIAGLLEVSGLHAGVQGAQNSKKGTATAAAHVATVNIGDGTLVINGIVGVASVTRNGKEVTRSTAGTKVLEVVLNGTPTTIPLEQIDLPGLVELEENVVKQTSNGLEVVALRIHLLDGSLAVIDLGTAIVGIKRARH